jgi:integrase
VTFELLFAFVVLGHGRRQLLWFAVTRHPTAEWLAQQIVEAFPWNAAPAYLVRDNDGAYGQAFRRRIRTMGIRDRPTSPRSPWADEEIAQYRAYWPRGTQQRLVMEFALETASRRGEVVRFGPQHVRNGRIRIDRTHGSEDVDMPMSPALQAACDAMPKVHLTYIITAHGKPRSKYGLGNDFARWVTEAGLPARCRLHGLKKGGMRRLAEAGGTAHELMAFSGHKTLTEVQRYTTDADRKRLADAAMAKLRDQSKNTDYTNTAPRLHKQAAKVLKVKD